MLLTKWDICNPLRGVLKRESERGGSGRKPALQKHSMRCVRTLLSGSEDTQVIKKKKKGYLSRGKLTSLSNDPVPLFFFPSITLSLKCQWLLVTQVHLHVLVFKTWQPAQIKRTFPSLSVWTFLSQNSQRAIGVLIQLHTCPQNKAKSSPQYYLQVTHWLLCVLFQTPKKTTNFY